ncbi:MAG: HAD family hydrolase [Chloroflexi bacterium]|nr:HAD family hydrolase [Chloroflexota bacterium]
MTVDELNPDLQRHAEEEMKPYLLLDAGGTLLFVDQDYLSRLADTHGYRIEARRFYEEHFRLVHWFDTYVSTRRQFLSGLSEPYSQILFRLVGLSEEEAGRAAQVAEVRHERRNLWEFTFPWIVETLGQLRDEGYRMSIISNADGRVEEELHNLEMRGYFERVYDSEVVGVRKPHPAIYELALNDLGLQPEEALFVGDMFYIDVWGANRVGIPGLHLDPLGLYERWPGARIQDLRQLPAWLKEYADAPERFDVLSLRDFSLLLEGDE